MLASLGVHCAHELQFPVAKYNTNATLPNHYLLVDDNETLLSIGTDSVFQSNDLLHTILDELPFCHHKLLPLLSTLVEESSVHLCFLIFQRDVAGQDVSVLHSLLHVWVSGTVIHHQPSDEPKK